MVCWLLLQISVEALTQHSCLFKQLSAFHFLCCYPSYNIYFVLCVPAAVGAVVRGALGALRPAAAAPPSAGFTQQTDPTEEETAGGGERADKPHVFLTGSNSLSQCEVCTGVCGVFTETNVMFGFFIMQDMHL